MDAPHRWDATCYRLLSWAEMLMKQGGPKYEMQPAEQTWESLTLYFFSEEQASRSEVDLLVRHFAREGCAPAQVSPRARYFFGYRTGCACDFVGMIFPPKSPTGPFGEVPAHYTDAQLAEWLLIDLWERRHDHWLKLWAISLYGPFAFYGIGPSAPAMPQ